MVWTLKLVTKTVVHKVLPLATSAPSLALCVRKAGGQEVDSFLTDNCKSPTGDMGAQNFNFFPLIPPKWRISSPKFVFLEEHFLLEPLTYRLVVVGG